MNDTSLARRRFLSHSICLIALNGIAGCTPTLYNADSSVGDQTKWLDDIAPDIAAAARIGQAYLDTHPQEVNSPPVREQLLALLRSDTRFVAANTDDERFAAISAMVSSDYIVADVVHVNGWILSRTEARIYSALAQESAAPLPFEPPLGASD